MKKSFFKSRSFKYGTLATILTAVFVAVVILLNVVFTALCNHYLWYSDLTKEAVFTLTDSTKHYLADIDAKIKIYFCDDEDKIKGDQAMLYVYNTAQLIADENPNISVECHNVKVEKAFFERFAATTTGITTTSVIIYNETSGDYRCPSYLAFFISDDSSVWAYNGEYKFVSYILQITSAEAPIVYFTLGHGEDVSENFAPIVSGDTTTNCGAYSLALLFADAGYDVRTIDLTRQTIDPDAKIIVIFDPAYDFIGQAEAESPEYNEIAILNNFLTTDDNALMVFGDPTHPGAFERKNGEPSSNLAELLDDWGLAFEEGTQVRDYQHSRNHDGLTLQPMYGKDALGASLYISLSGLSSMPMTAIRNSMAIRFTKGADFKKSNFDYCSVASVLDSYPTAELLKNNEVIEKDASFTLAAMARTRRIIDGEYGNNDDYAASYKFSYVLAFGSPSFASTSYLYSNVYANRDILFATMKAIGRDTILAGIDFKVLEDDEISVSTADANRWTAIMSTVLPALFAIAGITICVRRKRR